MSGSQSRVERFLNDQQGSATMEFVIWLPLLTLWLVFSTAIFIAYDSRNAAGKAAYAVSDILSRMNTVDAPTLEQITALNRRLVSGAPEGERMRVTSIRRTLQLLPDDPAYEVRWSCGYGGLDPLVPLNLPEELMPTMQPYDTIILTEFYVPFVPISTWGGVRAFDWSHVLVTRPRFTIELGSPSGGCGGGGKLYVQPDPPLVITPPDTSSDPDFPGTG